MSKYELMKEFWPQFAALRSEVRASPGPAQGDWPIGYGHYIYFMWWGERWLRGAVLHTSKGDNSGRVNKLRRAALNFSFAARAATTDEERQRAQAQLLLTTLDGGLL